MNNAKWTWFAIGYQTVFAYLVSLAIYQIGSLFTGGSFGVGTIAGFLVVALIVYLLARRGVDPDHAAPAKQKSAAGIGV